MAKKGREGGSAPARLQRQQRAPLELAKKGRERGSAPLQRQKLAPLEPQFRCGLQPARSRLRPRRARRPCFYSRDLLNTCIGVTTCVPSYLLPSYLTH